MTIGELRALLETLPDRLNTCEVVMYGVGGLRHVGTVSLDARKGSQSVYWPSVPAGRLGRKLRIRAGVMWRESPTRWGLEGSWPAEAHDIAKGQTA